MEPGKMSLEADGGNLTAFGNAIAATRPTTDHRKSRQSMKTQRRESRS
jgi:hypothetical protein